MNVTAPTIHPLDPLSADELTRAAMIFRETSKVSDEAYFACAIPAEPPKQSFSTSSPTRASIEPCA